MQRSDQGWKLATCALASGMLMAACVTDDAEREARSILTVRGAQISADEARRYLATYGYLSGAHEPVELGPEQKLKQALQLFQEIHELPVDGTLNDATRALMSLPRCGQPDHNLIQQHLSGGPSTRYTIISKWPHNSPSYRVDGYTPHLSPSVVDGVLAAAASQWMSANPALFLYKAPGYADFKISFVTGAHGDAHDFTATNPKLAHAFLPDFSTVEKAQLSGDIHFNDAYRWTVGGVPECSVGGPSCDLLWTTLHEFGHSLGLDHTLVPGSIMWPSFNGEQTLTPDDVEAILTNYVPAAPYINSLEPLCQPQYTLSWTAARGATRYELYVRRNGSAPVPLRSITELSTTLTVPSGEAWNISIRACHSLGCGSFNPSFQDRLIGYASWCPRTL